MTAVVPGGEERQYEQRSDGLFSTLTSLLTANTLTDEARNDPNARSGMPRIGSERSGRSGRKVSFTERLWTNFGSGGASQRGAHTTRQRRNSILAKVLGKDAEEAEHDALVNQHMILPGSDIYTYWNLTVWLFTVQQALCVPLVLGFSKALSGYSTSILPALNILGLFADLIFAMDIYVQMHAGYIHEGQLITDEAKVMKRYTENWLFYDALSSFPWQLLVLIVGTVAPSISITTVLLFRVFLWTRYNRYLNNLLAEVVTSSASTLVKLMLILVLTWHIVACLLHFMTYERVVDEAIDKKYLCSPKYEAHCDEWPQAYVYAFHWSIIKMNHWAYPHPYTLFDTGLSIFLIVIGILQHSYMIGTMGAYLTNSDANAVQFLQKMENVRRYMKFRKLSEDLQFRISNYLEYVWSRSQGFDEHTILDELSPPLRMSVLQSLHLENLKKIDWLTFDDESFMNELIYLLKPAVYGPGDTITAKGQMGSQMYFIVRGRAKILLPDADKFLEEGSFFGEMSVLFDQRRTATVQAVTFCDLFTLTQRDLYTLLDSFPGFAEKMRELALARCATFYPDLMSTLELGEEEEEMLARQQQQQQQQGSPPLGTSPKDERNLQHMQVRSDAVTKSPRKIDRSFKQVSMGPTSKQSSVGKTRAMISTSVPKPTMRQVSMRSGLSSQLSDRQSTSKSASRPKENTRSPMLQSVAEAKNTDTGDEEGTKVVNGGNTEEVMVVKDESDLFLDTGGVDKVSSILCAFEDEDPVSVHVSKASDKQMLLEQMKAHFKGLAEAMANGNEVDISYVDADGDTVQHMAASMFADMVDSARLIRVRVRL